MPTHMIDSIIWSIRKKGATQACAAKWLAPVKGQSGAA